MHHPARTKQQPTLGLQVHCPTPPSMTERIAEPQTKMLHGNLLRKEFQRLNLEIQATCNTEILKKAIEAWNEMEGCSIDFTSSLDNNANLKRQSIIVMVMDDPMGSGTYKNLLHVETPDNNGGFSKVTKIVINTANKLWTEIDDNQRQYLFMHALGHLVGMRHYEFGNDSDGTMNDSETIMLPETELATNKNLWKGFTQWDEEALQKFYPLQTAEWTVDCLPLPEEGQNTLKLGTKYTIAAGCDHAWVFNPSYSYEVIADEGVVSHKTKDNTLEMTFLRPGSCTVVAAAHDYYGEKDPDGNDYTYRTTYRVKATEPVFIYPQSIKLGEFCDFKFEVDEAAFPDAECDFCVNEYIFDNQSDISVTTDRISDHHVRYRFNDYGEYLISASCTYGGKKQTYNYAYRHLYRPVIQVDPHFDEILDPIESYVPQRPGTSGGDTIFGAAYKTDILLGATHNPLSERVYCIVHEQYHQFTHDLTTRRLDYRTITTKSEGKALPVGSSPLITLPERCSMLDPNFTNYTNHYRVLYPYGTVTYPSDYCGLVE